MAHSFDTGTSQPQRTILQDAVVSLLSGLKRVNGGYLLDVVPFGGVVRSYTDETDIQLLMKALGRSPSIAVATGTRQFQTLATQRTEFSSECELILYFTSQHERDMQTGRMASDVVALANDQADPGLHVAMAHALELICGVFPTTLTTTIKQVIPQIEEEFATLPAITIWRQVYRVMMTTLKVKGIGGNEFRTPAQLLESIGWRITTDPAEVQRPAAATSSTTIDEDTTL